MKKRTTLLRGAVVFCAILLVAAPAHANVGIPLFFYSWLGVVYALIPVIVVETVIVAMFGSLSGWLSAIAVTVANLASTAAGLPLAILHDLLIGSSSDKQGRQAILHSNVRFTWGFVLFLILLFGLSWWIETSVATRFLDQWPLQTVSEAMFYANLATYSVFFLLVLVMSVSEAVSARNREPEPLPYDYYAAARERRAEQLRSARNRDEILRCQDRPMHEPDLLEAWRSANRHSRQGMAFLTAAEAGMGRGMAEGRDDAGAEKITKRSSRAA